MAPSREKSIDILRGSAVFTMVAANLSAETLVSPHPFWFRAYGSFAAPIFIMVAGLMVGYTASRRGHGLGYYLLRGLMVMLVGAILDMAVYQIRPFSTCDVLYLIGLSIPVVFLSLRLSAPARWVAAFVVLGLGPLLQAVMGYSDYPTETYFSGTVLSGSGPPAPFWRAWLVDGWFPLFPWLGVALMGGNLASLRYPEGRTRDFVPKKFLFAGLLLMTVGILLWSAMPGPMYDREGFSELFYPPTPGFLLTSLGLAVFLLSLLDQLPELLLLRPFALLGGSSLFMYAFHLTANQYLIVRFWPEQPMRPFLLIYFSLIVLMVGLGSGLRFLRNAWPKMPFPVRFLIGG